MVVHAGAVNRDHVHMLLSIPPSLSVSRAVQYLKGRSSHKLLSEFGILRKRYWGQRGADIICCATNSRQPVLDGDWLEPGQMVVSIANSDVLNSRSEVDEKTFARASDIIINDWDSVSANCQVELTEPIGKGLVAREKVHTLGDVVAGRAKLRGGGDGIIYYKNNTGLAMQFAASGAILYRKLIAEGTNRVIPREWFASRKYHL
jgi:hypothetical protein